MKKKGGINSGLDVITKKNLSKKNDVASDSPEYVTDNHCKMCMGASKKKGGTNSDSDVSDEDPS